MGYRSQVCIGLDEEAHKVLNVVKRMCPLVNELLSYSDANHFLGECNKYMWDSVKWYEDNPDVHAIMSILKQFQDESWAMLRVGEDYEDIEVVNSPWEYDINLNRSIDW